MDSCVLVYDVKTKQLTCFYRMGEFTRHERFKSDAVT